MKIFKVYRHPTQGFVAIKEGFSWPAFFFGPVWMLVNKLWLLTSLWVGICVVCLFIQEVAFQPPVSGMQIFAFLVLSTATFGLSVVPAFKGNEWREWNFSKKGYELQDIVEAETPNAAVSQLAESA